MGSEVWSLVSRVVWGLGFGFQFSDFRVYGFDFGG